MDGRRFAAPNTRKELRNGRYKLSNRFCGWVVERTFAWLGQNRRLSKDYEYLCETSETFIYVAMIRLMLRRIACA